MTARLLRDRRQRRPLDLWVDFGDRIASASWAPHPLVIRWTFPTRLLGADPRDVWRQLSHRRHHALPTAG